MKQGNLTWAELSGHQQFWRMVLGWLAGSGIMGDCDLKNVSGCPLSSRRRGLGGEKKPQVWWYSKESDRICAGQAKIRQEEILTS